MAGNSDKTLEEQTEKNAPKKVFIDVDSSVADILVLDEEKAFIIFDVNPGRFKRLEESTIKMLSAVTRRAYFISEAIYDNKGTIPSSSESVEFDPTGRGGSIDLQYGNVELKNKALVSRYTREDLVYKRLRKGWKIAGENEVAFASSMKQDGHFETKDIKTGKTDQILMVMPRERYQKLYHDDRERRNRISEGLMENAAAAAQDKTGYGTEAINEKTPA